MNNSWSSMDQEGINYSGGRDKSKTGFIKEVTFEQGLNE